MHPQEKSRRKTQKKKYYGMVYITIIVPLTKVRSLFGFLYTHKIRIIENVKQWNSGMVHITKIVPLTKVRSLFGFLYTHKTRIIENVEKWISGMVHITKIVLLTKVRFLFGFLYTHKKIKLKKTKKIEKQINKLCSFGKVEGKFPSNL